MTLLHLKIKQNKIPVTLYVYINNGWNELQTQLSITARRRKQWRRYNIDTVSIPYRYIDITSLQIDTIVRAQFNNVRSSFIRQLILMSLNFEMSLGYSLIYRCHSVYEQIQFTFMLLLYYLETRRVSTTWKCYFLNCTITYIRLSINR